MDLKLALFSVFLLLAAFNAGAMTTLQIQHYSIYPKVGRDAFADYMRANNRAALVPAILPALLLLLVSTALTVYRPTFVSRGEALAALMLNLVALASTIVWQRRLQGEMALTGYDSEKIRRLIATNWIRTAAFLALTGLAGVIVLRALVMARP